LPTSSCISLRSLTLARCTASPCVRRKGKGLERGRSGYAARESIASWRYRSMSERVTALFPTRDDAERAAAALMDHGVSREEISLLARGPIRGDVPEPADPGALTYTSDADVKAGAAAGAGAGGLLGLLATAA